MRSAARSAIAIVGALVFARGSFGITEASTTLAAGDLAGDVDARGQGVEVVLLGQVAGVDPVQRHRAAASTQRALPAPTIT